MEDKLPFDFIYDGNEVNDFVPQEEEIVKALFRMRSRKAPGLSRISIDHIKKWYKLSHPKEGDEKVAEDIFEKTLECWKLVIKLVQLGIGKGGIPKAFYHGILVLIPKNEMGEVRGIDLLESIHKILSQIINLRLLI